jgi:uncharacterized membrane protein HdeD (DUF308 family)
MVTQPDQALIDMQHSLVSDIRHKSSWFLALGSLFLVLGVLAIVFPWVATLSFELVVGALFLIAGVAQTAHAFSIGRWKGFGMNLALGLLALIAGVLMLFFPVAGAVTLTTMVAVFLLVTGSIKTGFAFNARPAIGWGWILTSGLLSLALGVLILIQVAASMPWILGLLLGVDFLFSGFWILMLAIKSKQLTA